MNDYLHPAFWSHRIEPMASSVKINSQHPIAAAQRLNRGVEQLPRKPRPLQGRLYVGPLLRALSMAPGGRLTHQKLFFEVDRSEGKRVSGLDSLLHDLVDHRFVLNLGVSGYEITDTGRSFLKGLEMTQSAHSASSNRGGGEGV